jgi:hypothetical protein
MPTDRNATNLYHVHYTVTSDTWTFTALSMPVRAESEKDAIRICGEAHYGSFGHHVRNYPAAELPAWDTTPRYQPNQEQS